jgi:hypothetical protein
LPQSVFRSCLLHLAVAEISSFYGRCRRPALLLVRRQTSQTI